MTNDIRYFYGCTPEEARALQVFFAGISERQLRAWTTGYQSLMVILSLKKTSKMEKEALAALAEAAEVCPFAAFSLGHVLSERGDAEWSSAESLFRQCADRGLCLVGGAEEPFDNASVHRRVIRDVVGRAITKIGSHYGNLDDPEKATTYYNRALEIDPGNRAALVVRANLALLDGKRLGRPALAAIDDWREVDRNPRFGEEFDAWVDGRKNAALCSKCHKVPGVKQSAALVQTY